MALKDNLLAYYKLDEASGSLTRADSVSGSYDLDIINSVEQATGKIGNASHFSQSLNQGLWHQTSSNLAHQSSASAFTIACWANADRIGGNDQALVEKRNTTSLNDIEYGLWNVSTSWYLFVGNGATQTSVATDATGNSGSWVFLVTWYDPDKQEIYIQKNNGTVATSSWTGGTIMTGSGKFSIGRSIPWSGYGIDGFVDEVGYWNRTLTGNERTALYGYNASGVTYPLGLKPDFFSSSSYLDPIWTFSDPQGGSSYVVQGDHLELNVIGGITHDPTTVDRSVRVYQTVPRGEDFDIVLKMKQPPASNITDIGMIFHSLDDTTDTFFRSDIYHNGGNILTYSSRVTSGSSVQNHNNTIEAAGTRDYYWLRVIHIGSSWGNYTSVDGDTWVTQSEAITWDNPVNTIQIYAGGASTFPAYTASVDYIRNFTDPIPSTPVLGDPIIITTSGAGDIISVRPYDAALVNDMIVIR